MSAGIGTTDFCLACVVSCPLTYTGLIYPATLCHTSLGALHSPVLYCTVHYCLCVLHCVNVVLYMYPCSLA